MSLPPLNPRDPAAMAAASRRAHIAIRTARLRTLGTAGAITTLGVFTGLAAAYSPASPKPAAITAPVQNNSTVNPAPAPQYDVAPPRPAAPPATMSSTS